jgi:hypothetical protein
MGTFQTSRDVRLESEMRTKADVADRFEFMVHALARALKFTGSIAGHDRTIQPRLADVHALSEMRRVAIPVAL